MPIEQFRVMLDLNRAACFAPVHAHRAYAMRADAEQLYDFVLGDCFEIFLRQSSEQQIVAEPTRRIAVALFFFQNAERDLRDA